MPELIPAAPLSPEWHAARRGGVTATDIVTILGLSSTDSVYSLFWRKMQQAPEQPETDRMRLGRELERYILTRWLEETDPETFDGVSFNAGLWHHSQRKWQMATLDSLVDPMAPLELKSWADADRHSWDGGPPARVRAQVLWQMDVMDVAAGHVGVLFLPSGEFRSYIIEHDPAIRLGYDVTHTLDRTGSICDLCSDILLMRLQGIEFMQRLNLELPPPDPDSSAATLAAVRARFTRQPDKQAEVDASVWFRWEITRDAMKSHEDLARELEIQLREQAGEASVLTVDGQPVARRIITEATVKEHVRRQDYLRRITPRGDENDG